MCLKILFTFAILFYSTIMREILSDESNVIAAYRKLIINKKDNDNEFTSFCLNNNKKTMTYICDRALEQIRKNYPYNDVYLYPKYFESKLECLRMSVELEKNWVEMQYMKPCPSSLAVLDTRSLKFYDTSLMVSAINLHNIFVFKRNGSGNNYTILAWFHEPEPVFNTEPKPSPIFEENRVIPQVLFQQKPPSSIDVREENFSIFISSLIPPKKLNKKNIVNKSDADMFAKLCIMALRRSKYPDVIVDVMTLAEKKSKIIYLQVEIEEILQVMSLRWCPVKQIEMFFPNEETWENLSKEEIEKLKDVLLKYDNKLTPEHMKKILNLDKENFYKKMNEIRKNLMILLHPTHFFLSQGPTADSLLVIKGTIQSPDTTHLKNVHVEFIQNISDEYVNRMDLNNETQFLKSLINNFKKFREKKIASSRRLFRFD